MVCQGRYLGTGGVRTDSLGTKLTCEVEVKGQKYQGQRSHWSRSNNDPKQRQVGSLQLHVAFL